MNMHADYVVTPASPLVVTLFGIATGLDPALLLAAFWGALWSVRGARQRGFLDRGWKVTTGTLFGAWAAKSAVAVIVGTWPAFAAAVDLKFPVAFAVGMFGLKWLDRWAERKIDGAGR